MLGMGQSMRSNLNKGLRKWNLKYIYLLLLETSVIGVRRPQLGNYHNVNMSDYNCGAPGATLIAQSLHWM